MAIKETDKAESIAYRKKRFAVRIELSRYAFEESYDLLVTHNGAQWSGMNLTKAEMPYVIRALATVLNDG